MELHILLQEPVTLVMPELFKYGIGGLLAFLGIGYGLMERKERIKIQDEHNKMESKIDEILKELKD